MSRVFRILLFKAPLFAAVALVFSGCNVGDEVDSLKSIKDERKVWVFAQLNVSNEGNEIDSYYYYGRISENLYQRIRSNKISRGFLLLEDVRYYSGKDDKIHPYKDADESGELVFRIEDIKRIRQLARPPQMEKPLGEAENKAAAKTTDDHPATQQESLDSKAAGVKRID